MSYFLGIDGGGTKTASAVLDETGAELGRGLGGPCNIATGDDETLRQSVLDAVNSAMKSAGLSADAKFEAVCAGVAGYTAKRRRADFTDLLRRIVPADSHRVEPDYVIAYWGATEGEPGIIVSAGTGAVIYGKNDKGEAARSDGLGFVLGDRGSAFELGRIALNGLAMTLENGSRLSPYEREIMACINANDLDDIVEWTYREFSPSKIAALSSTIGKLATAGSKDAERGIKIITTRLASSTIKVMTLSGLGPVPTKFYLLGGLWECSPVVCEQFENYLKETFRRLLKERIPRLDIQHPRHDAAHGAALLSSRSSAEND